MHDWLILLLLVVIEVVLYVIHPFYRFVGKDMMTDLKYPLNENTVPVWAVPVSFSSYFIWWNVFIRLIEEVWNKGKIFIEAIMFSLFDVVLNYLVRPNSVASTVFICVSQCICGNKRFNICKNHTLGVLFFSCICEKVDA